MVSRQVFLVEKGADINAVSNHGWTALFMAAQKGHTEAARILLDKGIDVSVKDKSSRTAREEAEINRHMDTASLIAEYLKNP